jgi:hypothetical protein
VRRRVIVALACVIALTACGVFRIVVEDYPYCPPPPDTTGGKRDTLYRPLGCPGTLPPIDTTRRTP